MQSIRAEQDFNINCSSVCYEMNRLAMNGRDPANSSNGGRGYNCKSDSCCPSSTVKSFAEESVDRGSNCNSEGGNATFPPTFAAIPSIDHNHNHNHNHTTRNFHSNPHPYSKQPHTTPYHTNTGYVLPPLSLSSPDHPNAESTKGKFDPASIMLQDLCIGPVPSADGADLSLLLPTIKQKVSPMQYYNYDKVDSCGGAGSKHSSRYNSNSNANGNINYHIHPSHHGSPQPRIPNHKYKQRQLLPYQEEHHQRPIVLKKPPPNYVAPLEKHFNTKRKPSPLSPSLEKYKQCQETLCGRKQHPRDSQPLQLPSTPPLSTPRQQTEKQDILGVRKNERPDTIWPTRPARFPSVPRAIDVDLSYNNYCYDGNDASHPLPSQLSPISFSSSMFLKRAPIDNYYPSKDTIEKQLSSHPPIESIFSTVVVLPPFPDPPASNTKRRQDESGRVIGTGNTTTAATTKTARLHELVYDRTNTELPSSEEKTNAAFENRPEKPLRINSQFPSQLQLHQQRQLQTESQYPKNPRISNQSAQPLPEDDPRMPIGNGVTNDIATGIDARMATSSRQRLRTFVPMAHYQEYDLQLSLPTTTTSNNNNNNNNTTRAQKVAQPPTNRENGNTSKVVYNHRDNNNITTNDDDSIPLPVVEVEIYPGVYQILRGAQETANAAKRNYVVDCTCLICTVECSCIADAAFVICPTCLVVNSLEGSVTTTKAAYKNNHNDTTGRIIGIESRWGVGLGFIPEKRVICEKGSE